MLVGTSDSDLSDRKITLHHNYFYNCNSRLPLFRAGNGHVFDNLFDVVASTGVGAARVHRLDPRRVRRGPQPHQRRRRHRARQRGGRQAGRPQHLLRGRLRPRTARRGSVVVPTSPIAGARGGRFHGRRRCSASDRELPGSLCQTRCASSVSLRRPVTHWVETCARWHAGVHDGRLPLIGCWHEWCFATCHLT